MPIVRVNSIGSASNLLSRNNGEPLIEDIIWIITLLYSLQPWIVLSEYKLSFVLNHVNLLCVVSESFRIYESIVSMGVTAENKLVYVHRNCYIPKSRRLSYPFRLWR